MAENLLSLSWNNHLINWKHTLSHIMQKDTFSDVTIVCEGNFYSVHKIVLASCSEYFSAVLEKTPCPHPFIILKDISTNDVTSLIAYMYRGEVSVNQSEVPSLIRAAETLGIKGLAANEDPLPLIQTASIPTDCPPRPRPKKRRTSSICEGQVENLAKVIKCEASQVNIDHLPVIDLNEIKELESTKKTLEKNLRIDETLVDFPSNTSDFLGIEELNIKRESEAFVNHRSAPGKELPCDDLKTDYIVDNWLAFDRVCISPTEQDQERLDDLYFEDLTDRQDHTQSLLQCHPCTLCPKLFQSRADVVRHMRTHTGEKPFKCPHCDYRAALKGNLKSHIVSRHPSLCV